MPVIMIERKRKFFDSRSLKATLNGISFTFVSYLKTSDLHLVPEEFYL